MRFEMRILIDCALWVKNDAGGRSPVRSDRHGHTDDSHEFAFVQVLAFAKGPTPQRETT
jgi:hypothetical protein